jgi:PHP family Zn ribbon phosphoesterase
MYRVAERADPADLTAAKKRKEYWSITSLPSLLSEISGAGETSKKTRALYTEVQKKLGSDFHVLLFAGLDEIAAGGGELLAEGIRRMRARQVYLEEGYDGEFGSTSVYSPAEQKNFPCLNANATEHHTEKNSIEFDISAFQKKLQQHCRATQVSSRKKSSSQPDFFTD